MTERPFGAVLTIPSRALTWFDLLMYFELVKSQNTVVINYSG